MEFLALLLFSMLRVIVGKDLLGFEMTSSVEGENIVSVVSNNTNVSFEAGLTICFRAKIQFWIERTLLITEGGSIAIGLDRFRNDIHTISFGL